MFKLIDSHVVAVTFKNGAFGVIQGTTSEYPGQDSRFELHGEKGSIIFGDQRIQTWEILNGGIERPIESGSSKTGSDPSNLSIEGHSLLIEDLIDPFMRIRTISQWTRST